MSGTVSWRRCDALSHILRRRLVEALVIALEDGARSPRDDALYYAALDWRDGRDDA
jgi:hypothetical protein